MYKDIVVTDNGSWITCPRISARNNSKVFQAHL
jgi:hypothetical protein